MHALVISRLQQRLNTLVVVGTWASVGFLKTGAAWFNFAVMLALLAVALGGNRALLKWRALVARHNRRKAETELLKKGQ